MICSTDQHTSLLTPFLKQFHLTPDVHLDVFAANQSLASLTAKCMSRLESVYQAHQPDLVLVQGDTTTAMSAALSAFYAKIPVAHIEAGLRTYCRYSPFPEEINRQLISRLASLHFVPTASNKVALEQEGIDSASIFMCGNTGIDALFWMKRHQPSELSSVLKSLPCQNKPFILVTSHRREQVGKPFESICQALLAIAKRYPDITIIYPLHLNPNIQDPARHYLSGMSNIVLCEPLNYSDFVYLLMHAALILTDSGGVQEEAPSFRVPVLVLRESTERKEGVEKGFSYLVGTDKDAILYHVDRCLTDSEFYQPKGENPYGDGKASEKIAEIILHYLTPGEKKHESSYCV